MIKYTSLCLLLFSILAFGSLSEPLPASSLSISATPPPLSFEPCKCTTMNCTCCFNLQNSPLCTEINFDFDNLEFQSYYQQQKYIDLELDDSSSNAFCMYLLLSSLSYNSLMCFFFGKGFSNSQLSVCFRTVTLSFMSDQYACGSFVISASPPPMTGKVGNQGFTFQVGNTSRCQSMFIVPLYPSKLLNTCHQF